MFLNDAFDADIDRHERPERPIPSGRVGSQMVFAYGGIMLAASVFGLAIAGILSGSGLFPAGAGVLLAVLIVIYNWRHKDNPLSPIIMGLCRVLVYVIAGLCVTTDPPAALWIGAFLLLCHLIGLTYIAKQESLGRIANLWPLLFLAAPLVAGIAFSAREPVGVFLWLALIAAVLTSLRFIARRGPGDISRAVTTLIASISLLDSLLIAGQGKIGLALTAAFGFVVTLVLQRFVRGT
jgi:4-hydroxybenzoate polyprenyltransferase